MPCPEQHKDQHCDNIKYLLEQLSGLHCGICGLHGHQESYCWLNGQVFGCARSAGKPALTSNMMWREGIKTRTNAKSEQKKEVARAMGKANAQAAK